MSVETFRSMLDDRPIKYFLQYLVKKRSEKENLRIFASLNNKINEELINFYFDTADAITAKDPYWFDKHGTIAIFDYFTYRVSEEIGENDDLVIDLFQLFVTHFAIQLHQNKKVRKLMGIKKGIFS